MGALYCRTEWKDGTYVLSWTHFRKRDYIEDVIKQMQKEAD